MKVPSGEQRMEDGGNKGVENQSGGGYNGGGQSPQKGSAPLDYLRKSVNQVLLGNFTKDVTLLGTVAQIALGLTDADLPGDLRDLTYDLIHWKWTPEHGIQTLLDVVGVLPVIGALKYSDKFSTLIKSLKKADDAEKAAKSLSRMRMRLRKR